MRATNSLSRMFSMQDFHHLWYAISFDGLEIFDQILPQEPWSRRETPILPFTHSHVGDDCLVHIPGIQISNHCLLVLHVGRKEKAELPQWRFTIHDRI